MRGRADRSSGGQGNGSCAGRSTLLMSWNGKPGLVPPGHGVTRLHPDLLAGRAAEPGLQHELHVAEVEPDVESNPRPHIVHRIREEADGLTSPSYGLHDGPYALTHAMISCTI